jgi:polyisoprenoid-binding protein YceI
MIAWLGGGDPKGQFEFKKSWVDEKGNRHAMGNLTIKGVSKTISFPFTSRKDGDWVTIDGKATLNYEDFSLPIIRAMAVMTVDPKLTVRFHIVGQIK